MADLPQVPNCSHETDGDKDESEEQLVQRASACTYLMVLGPLFLLLFRSFFLLRFRQGCTIAARLAALIGGCSPLARLFGHRRIVLGGCRSPGQRASVHTSSAHFAATTCRCRPRLAFSSPLRPRPPALWRRRRGRQQKHASQRRRLRVNASHARATARRSQVRPRPAEGVSV